MTAPRQLLGWTVPEHIATTSFLLAGDDVEVLVCTYEPGPVKVTIVGSVKGDKRIGQFLRDHAHGVPVGALPGVLPETPEPPKACKCCATNDDPGFRHGGQCGQCGHTPRSHDSFRAQLDEPAVHRLKIERPTFGAVVYSGVCSCNRWSADLYDPADISSCWVVNHLMPLAPTDAAPAPQSSPAPLLPLSAPVETEGQVEGRTEALSLEGWCEQRAAELSPDGKPNAATNALWDVIDEIRRRKPSPLPADEVIECAE